MNFAAGLLVIAVVVIVLAFVLGRLYQRREAQRTAAPPAREAAPRLFVLPGEREEEAVITWLLSQAFEQTGIKVADDKVAYQRIVEAARQALTELRRQPDTNISLPFLTADANGPKHFHIRLTRDTLKELARY